MEFKFVTSHKLKGPYKTYLKIYFYFDGIGGCATLIPVGMKESKNSIVVSGNYTCVVELMLYKGDPRYPNTAHPLYIYRWGTIANRDPKHQQYSLVKLNKLVTHIDKNKNKFYSNYSAKEKRRSDN